MDDNKLRFGENVNLLLEDLLVTFGSIQK